MITTITKRNTQAPTAPITSSIFWTTVSDFNSTSKVLYEKYDESIEYGYKQEILFSTTDHLNILNDCYSFFQAITVVSSLIL